VGCVDASRILGSAPHFTYGIPGEVEGGMKKALFSLMVLAGLISGCTQQGGYGGGGEGQTGGSSGGGQGVDQRKSLRMGAGKESNTNVSENSGNPKGTVTPRGTPSSTTADGSK
jgi:hypothetical protein